MLLDCEAYIHFEYIRVTAYGIYLSPEAPVVLEEDFEDYRHWSDYAKVFRLGPNLSYRDFDLDFEKCGHSFWEEDEGNIIKKHTMIYFPYEKTEDGCMRVESGDWDSDDPESETMLSLRKKMWEAARRGDFTKAAIFRNEFEKRRKESDKVRRMKNSQNRKEEKPRRIA
ncbi:MAG TPA: hypothetical protein VG694_02630 [Candidatus Paceibacterota bacterium]|jgi:hypothetical protein|nr:hypothetical protein [Candidatus Paceibacterota bacterium]